MRTPLALVAVLALVGLTALAVRVMSADADGCSSGVTLTVAAVPEIAPAVQEAALAWEGTQPDVNGKCIQVEVKAVSAADVAAALAVRGGGSIDVAAKPAATPSAADIPAVWIPESTAWLGRVAAIDRTVLSPSAPPVATTPVVFAVPEAVAQALPAAYTKRGAAGLLQAALADVQQAITSNRPPSLAVGMLDPRRDAASLAAALVVRDAVVTDESRLPALIAVYRQLNKGRVADLSTLQKAFSQGVQAAPLSEQAVLAVNAASPNSPLLALPLPPGGPALDYPYATIGGKSREVELAASKFRTALAGPAYREPLTKRGFRAPDGTAGTGFPVGHGVTAGQAVGSGLTDAARVAETLGLWSAANSPSRALALMDVTSSMGRLMTNRSGAPIARLRVMQDAAVAGLSLFSDQSSLGIWAFGAGHREAAPVGELTAEHRAELNTALRGASLAPTDDCGLYQTLRDAYQAMVQNYVPGVTNRIILFTDGNNNRGSMNLEQLTRDLEMIATITKPIEVTVIGVGPDVDIKQLNQVAAAAGARQAYHVLDAQDIRAVFLKALLS
jgi:Ca-activated chloride channel family protein